MDEFKKGKLKKQDVRNFYVNMEEHIFSIHEKLKNFEYSHNSYESFFICDPKRRNIHKATVRDRLLHHAIFRVLEPVFDKTFIFDSYSSRKEKGIHKAHDRFRNFAWKLSRNNTKTVWVLKCDIRKFFDSVDHATLISLLKGKIKDKTIDLLKNIISSFEMRAGKGIPIGNLTSQLFSNIYLNELDQYLKRELRIKHYIRYADDFVVLSGDKQFLCEVIPKLNHFLKEKLALEMHPNKILIRKWNQGIDFLGYVISPYHKILRTKTKNRVLKKLKRKRQEFERGLISEFSFEQSINSYLGMLQHCRGKEVERKIWEIVEN